MQAKISIIIPCYNVEKYISQCIESLLNQTIGIENLELIFVNDASTDRTLDRLLEYEKTFAAHMMIINLPENVKQGGARNIGLQYATAEYIGFVDADDWVEPNMYEILYKTIVEHDADIVNCGMLRNYESGACEKVKIEFEQPFLVEKSVMEGGSQIAELYYGIVTKLYRKSLIIDNQIWFPEKIAYEDNYWGAILVLYVKSVVYVKEFFYHYRENTASTTLKRNDRSHFDRLDIEIMKINKYKELGIFERLHDEIEKKFLDFYYFNTLYIMFKRFDKVQYDIFLRMQKEVKQYFPDYQNNKYLKEIGHTLGSELLRLIELDISEEDLQNIASIYDKEI